MSDYARFKNIEPMYKAKIHQQEILIKQLREKIRLLESHQDLTEDYSELSREIEARTKIYEAEIVEEEN